MADEAATAVFTSLRSQPAWDAPLGEWYVPRQGDFKQQVLAELLHGNESGVVWVTAPTGGGLSSELASLSAQLEGEGQRVVRATLLGRLEPGLDSGPTCTFLLLLFWLVRSFSEDELKKAVLGRHEAKVHQLVEHLRELAHIPPQTAREHWSARLGRTLFISLGLIRDRRWRDAFEADPKLRPVALAELAGHLIEMLAAQAGPVVVVVDDTNRMDLFGNGDRLLLECASLWQTLPARVVLAYPRRLDFSPEFHKVVGAAPRVLLEPLTAGEQASFFQQLLALRAPSVSVSQELVGWAAGLSFGNPAEFLRLLGDALRLAALRGATPDGALLDEVSRRRGWDLLGQASGAGQHERLLEAERSGHFPGDAPHWLSSRLLLEHSSPPRARLHPAALALLTAASAGAASRRPAAGVGASHATDHATEAPSGASKD